MILDVGCGTNYVGDVNCDLYVDDIGHRSGRRDVSVDRINVKAVPNFVLCDALHLPFKDASFPKVVCRHLIEHVSKPESLMFELLRVSQLVVEVACPNALGEHRSDFHMNHFRSRWFWNFGKRYCNYVFVYTSQWRCFPSDLFCLFRLPSEISARFVKR